MSDLTPTSVTGEASAAGGAAQEAVHLDNAGQRWERPFVLLLVCFFLSGFAGLVYQTAWTRQFAFVFGTSNLAVATVLAAYMGGLAGGAALAARYANRVRRPVLTYGLLELFIGLSALAVPFAIGASRWLYVALFGAQEVLPERGGLLTALFYLVGSFLILSVPTGMMGATLPLLTRHAVRSDAQISRRSGLLYATNTAGAVGGTLAAAFWLLPGFGLGRTVQIAALINGVVFLAAWGLARSASAERDPDGGARRPAAAHPGGGTRSWILPLIFGSGVASFTYEVAWVRLLEHVLGGSVYAFATMLASFLLGITLGSEWASRLATTKDRASLAFVVVQIGIAVTAAGAFLLIGPIHQLTAAWTSDTLVSAGDVIASMLTLFPAATFIGATFPLAVRILARNESEAGSATALVYAANTVGAIVGAVGAGFFLVPLLDYAGTFVACAALNLVLAGGAAVAFHPRRPVLAAIAAAGAILVVVAQLPTPWTILRHSPLSPNTNDQGTVEYYGVGRAATVLLLSSPPRWYLRTNGLPESMIDGPHVNHIHLTTAARWLGMLPVLARPSARSMMVVGLGGGVVVEAAPSALERIDVVELEQEVVAANRAVGERRWRDPLADPRVRLYVNDARNALLLTDQRYDAIVSQPSHPWAGSSAHLYTQEFFQLARSRLQENGVFVQWMGLAFVDEMLFQSLVTTLGSVFEHVRVYRPGTGGVLFLASAAPLDVESSGARALREAPDDFATFGVRVPEDLTAALLLDEAGAKTIGRGAPLNRDDRNLLQSRSSLLGSRALMHSGSAFFDEPDLQPRWPRSPSSAFYVLERLPVARAEQLAAGLDPDDREAALAVLEMRKGQWRRARERLDALLASAPRHEQGRALRLRLSTAQISRGTDPESLVAAPLSEVEQSVTAGWRALALDDTSTLRALEPSLAAVPVRHGLQADAVRLRAEWRTRSGSEELAREAMTLVDRELSGQLTQRDFLLRARAALVSGKSLAALDTLLPFAARLDPRRPAHVRLGTRALSLLETIPPDPELSPLRSQIQQMLRARMS